jgi:predicted molibdopterin-dependent oxidoreductase YjgC
VQKLNPGIVPPLGALQDWEIFSRLLARAGEKAAYATAPEIFLALAREIPAYGGLSFGKIGDQGFQLGDETRQP